MARTPIPLIVLDSTVNPPTLVSGATVAVLNQSDNSAAVVYQDFTGTDVRTQPLSTDSSGRINGYLDRGSYKFVITIPSRSPYNEYWASTPGSAGGIDTDWLADDAVTTAKVDDGAITADKLAAGAVATAGVADGSITTDKLAATSVTAAKMATNAVATATIADGAVTAAKLASASVSPITQHHGFAIGGVILIPANNTTDPNLNPGFHVRILGAHEVITLVAMDYRIHGGTSCTFSILKNGTGITGWTGKVASTTAANNTLGSPVTLANGDYLQVQPTAVSGTANGLAVTIHTLHYPLG